ncbi:MAG: hypothetical protein OXM58_04155 [Rhodospirillaceae bacterium]|nr:hypothetical protein [Rhodospirillaceae bacterium]MDE0617672.1 hypothetical protein [Rhodospirillaceae bacterium]
MIQTMEARGMDAGMDPSDISAPLLSATVLLLRDGARGLEVFMVERSGRVGAFAGAMVFPGGKVAPEDSSAELRALADNGGDLDDAAFGFAVSSVREAFEECGVLLAHRNGATLTDAELAPLAGFRDAIGRNRIPFARFLADHGLRLDMAGLAPFSRWVTPVFRPKRFDTMFFLAAVPPDQTLSHDGSETVHGLWTRPQDVIDAADRDRKYSLYFATRLNLMDLALSGTVADALARAAGRTPPQAMPWREMTPDGPRLRIDADSGYALVQASLEVAGGIAPLPN